MFLALRLTDFRLLEQLVVFSLTALYSAATSEVYFLTISKAHLFLNVYH